MVRRWVTTIGQLVGVGVKFNWNVAYLRSEGDHQTPLSRSRLPDPEAAWFPFFDPRFVEAIATLETVTASDLARTSG